MCVVELLEVINIDQHKAKVRAIGQCIRAHSRRCLIKSSTVGNTGQGVGAGVATQAADLRFHVRQLITHRVQ